MNLFAKAHTEKAHAAEYLLNKYSKKSDSVISMTVNFYEDTKCEKDNYRIRTEKDEIKVFANTAVGFNAAAGYLVRHCDGKISDVDITFESDFRAVYFANHFYNYYHSAPTEEICEYIESLALWGQNALCLWFDMHHFESAFQPEAAEMIEKMKCLFKKAKSLGMKTSLTRLANEYYSKAPAQTLAENSTESGKYEQKLCGFYYTELCPSNVLGENLLLSSFCELMECFLPVGLDYIMFWPYDQGGCTCNNCYPWGSNGFYKLAKKQAKIAKEYYPHMEIIFSCWRFDHFTGKGKEWSSFVPLVREDGEWIDRLMVDIDSESTPYDLDKLSGKPVVSFPEISMRNATPWGGFGANPFPTELSAQFKRTFRFCKGGALYSEGIFEDINKAVSLELMRDHTIDPKQTVLEYCNYHFGAEYSEQLAEIIFGLEKTLNRATFLDNERCDFPSKKPYKLYSYKIENPDFVKELSEKLLRLHKKLPAEVVKNPRYQLIFARVMGDLALVKNDGVPNFETDAIYSRLVDLYHAEKAYYFVSPITTESIMENRGGGI